MSGRASAEPDDEGCPLQRDLRARGRTEFTYSDPTGLWLDDGTGQSEPNPKDHSGNHRNNVGVPRGGTGTSGCYYTCGAILDDQSTAAYYATVASAEQGLPYVRNAQTVSRDEFHRAMVKYQGIQDGAVQDSQWMMWLFGYDEEVIDNFGPCMIFDCHHGVTSDDIRSMPLNNESFMEQFGRAYAEGSASRLGVEGKGAARAGGCLNHSFVAGTEVQLADGDTEPIEDIKIGDKVTATDPQTGKTSTHDVINTIVTKHDEHFVKVTVAAPDVDDSEGSLTATTTHPFWSPSTGGWVDGADLRAGMSLRTPDGQTVEIASVSHFTKRQTTYDLTVSGVHTYYVLAGDTPVLVHNASCVASYDADFAMGQLTRNGTAKASRLEEFGNSNGWIRSQTENGPIKFRDANGILRLTVKKGTGRAPGSSDPHVEMRNADGERIDSFGNPVTRKSPGNHTPIEWDLG
ncbi:Hint domain-containing protein [Streptomyces sp. NPDC003737]|uniref:Hint domain-containing protein n=1 Tax=Streptomyces sp. NPDC003737 TaxID=3364685 RepID=UPI0036B0A361